MRTIQTPDNQSNLVAIYFLVDPRIPGIVRYVGQSKTPRIRHLQHCQENNTTRKATWIEALRLAGIFPQMIVIDWVPDKDANRAEAYWIARLKPDLTNTKAPVVEVEPEPIEANPERLPSQPAQQPCLSFNPPTKVTVPEVGSLHEVERAGIERALSSCHGNKLAASKLLGIGRQTLYNKLTQYGLHNHQYR